MPPKKKPKTAEETDTKPQDTQPVLTPTSKPPADKPDSKPTITKSVEPNKPQPSATLKTDEPEEQNNKQSTIIKLDEGQVEKKLITLETEGKTEREMKEIRAFKFGGKETNISVDDASKLMSERAKKFGGEAPMSSDERKRRAEKFGGTHVDKEELKELKKKRQEKFGSNQNPSSTQHQDILITEEQRVILEARKNKFKNVDTTAPEKQQKTE